MTITPEDILRLSVPPPRSIGELEAMVAALEADKMALAAQLAKALDRATAAEWRVKRLAGYLGSALNGPWNHAADYKPALALLAEIAGKEPTHD